MIELLTALTVLAQLVVIIALGSWMLSRFCGGPRALDLLTRWIGSDSLRLAWLVAAVAMAGSLYMSEARHFQPCVLCWYQRIAMYPVVLILGIASLRRDLTAWWYALPFALIGAAISVYHYQLERFPDQEQIACSATVPCTTIWFEQLGYITLPMMALSAFALIATVLTIGKRHGQSIANQA